jgi:hypothetical protein
LTARAVDMIRAAKTLAELQRGLEERRELIRSGAFEKMMAAAAAAHAAA